MELNATINNSQQFIGQQKYLSLSNKCQKLKDQIERRMDNMDDEEQQSVNKLQKVVGGLSSTVKYMGAVGRIVYRLFGALY